MINDLLTVEAGFCELRFAKPARQNKKDLF